MSEIGPIFENLLEFEHRFDEPDKFQVRGGVEFGFLSCSTERAEAEGYAKGKVLLSIQTGAVTRGASLSWLSYYPEEKEVLLPPCTALEAVGTPVITDLVEVRLLAVSRLPARPQHHGYVTGV